MPLPGFLADAATSWAGFYDAHRMISVTIRFLHLGGIVAGGGTALLADARILRAWRSAEAERRAAVAALGATHRVVVPALALVALAGVLMTAADTTTFLSSRLYWSKLLLVTLLVLNGAGLLAAEGQASRDPIGRFSRLGLASAASLVLWLAILYAGVWLTVAA